LGGVAETRKRRMIYVWFFPLVAILSIVFFWVLVHRRANVFSKLLIKNDGFKSKETPLEIKRNVWSMVIFALVGSGCDWMTKHGFTASYSTFESYDWYYIPISLLLALAVNDMYFYMSHRFLHWKPMFKHVHHLHHESKSPNALSSFSFHPMEAVIQIGLMPLVLVVVPMHAYAFLGFASFFLFMSVYGHCGYEFRGSKPEAFQIFNNAIHHHQHHRYVRCNYGLYLNVWDRLFKTNHPKYLEETKAFKSRLEQL
jgi:sterol desaturase/sphingolipid hydroxylase (fatty acid hydroxylase superfamily)